MARVTAEALEDVPRKPVSLRERLPKPPRALRSLPIVGIGRSLMYGAVGAILVNVALYAPDLWMQAVVLFVIVAIAYLGGVVDGRRDLAVSALRLERDDRTVERPPERGEEPAP